MKRRSFRLTWQLWICLYSIFLITAGISRYVETDSGNILIHDIEVESFEGYLYPARLFRPIQASSMNRRPGITIFFGASGNRYTGDHIAMEFARRGFVVLTIEKDPDAYTGPYAEETMENPIDSAYTFLTTRFFTDPERTGLIVFYTGSGTALESEHLHDFTSVHFVSPVSPMINTGKINTEEFDIRISAAKFETDPDHMFHNEESSIEIFSSSHAGMVFHNAVIAYLLEQFHETLAIPNDSPFWFSAQSQRAQILLLLRGSLLLLLLILSTDLHSFFCRKQKFESLYAILGIVLAIFFFIVTSEILNFFIISVRIGHPFGYLPKLSHMVARFSPLTFALFIIAGCLCSLSIKTKKSSVTGEILLSDICGICLTVLCMIGFLPVFLNGSSGWEFLGLIRYRPLICLFTFFVIMNSILFRMVPKGRLPRTCNSVLTGCMFYFIYCGLPDAVFL